MGLATQREILHAVTKPDLCWSTTAFNVLTKQYIFLTSDCQRHCWECEKKKNEEEGKKGMSPEGLEARLQYHVMQLRHNQGLHAPSSPMGKARWDTHSPAVRAHHGAELCWCTKNNIPYREQLFNYWKKLSDGFLLERKHKGQKQYRNSRRKLSVRRL